MVNTSSATCSRQEEVIQKRYEARYETNTEKVQVL
jgi:hypothetical protein